MYRADEVPDAIIAVYDVIKRLQEAEVESGYQVKKLVEWVKA